MRKSYQLEHIYRSVYTEGKQADQIIKQAIPIVKQLNASSPQANDEGNFDLADLMDTKNDIQVYPETDYPVFSYKTLELYLEFSYDSKNPLLIYGEPGLGKSAIVTNFAKNVAHHKNKEFVNWVKSSNEKKLEVLNNPLKYFVLVDIRAVQLDPTDLVGIPDIYSKTKYLETRQPKWIYLFSLEDTDGILFLDEINQASRQTLNSLFEVVLDRSAGGTAFSKDMCLIAAGNLNEEHGNEMLPPALTNRFKAGVLVADHEGWLKWAERENIDKFIIAFVKHEPESTFDPVKSKPTRPGQQFPTPRQLVRFSHELKKMYKQYKAAKDAGRPIGVPLIKAIGDTAASYCGAPWGVKFVNFIKHVYNMTPQDIISTGKNLSKYTVERLSVLVFYIENELKKILPLIAKDGTITDPYALEVIEALATLSMYVKPEWRDRVWANIKDTLPTLDKSRILMALHKLGVQIKQRDPKILEHFKTTMIGVNEYLGDLGKIADLLK